MKFKCLASALALAATPAVAENVGYSYADDSFTGYFAAAEEPRGLILIVHDWDGLTEYERRRADMLAEMGYDAFALDMFGDDTPTETMDHRRAATGALYQDRARMRGLLEAGLEQARGQSGAEGLVVMGYCFGGAVTLEMARSDMADAAAGYASFHGGLSTPEGQGWDGDEPPLLILHGREDQTVPLRQAERLLAAAEDPKFTKIYEDGGHENLSRLGATEDVATFIGTLRGVR